MGGFFGPMRGAVQSLLRFGWKKNIGTPHVIKFHFFLLRNYELSEKAKGSEASGIEFINIKMSRLAYSTLSVLA